MTTRTMYGIRARAKGAKTWDRVRTKVNPAGRWSTRAGAASVLKKLHARGYAGSVIILKVTVVTGQPAVNVWLKGNVVPIADVPSHLRVQYRDTLYRAARAAKRYGKPIQVNDSYRSIEQQWELYNRNMLSPGRPRPGRPLTAYPNVNAPHVRGIALDIPNARSTPKLIKELRAEGLIDSVPSEQWHVENSKYR